MILIPPMSGPRPSALPSAQERGPTFSICERKTMEIQQWKVAITLYPEGPHKVTIYTMLPGGLILSDHGRWVEPKHIEEIVSVHLKDMAAMEEADVQEMASAYRKAHNSQDSE